ncbi:MAG: hypothetical protein QOF39_966 [Frankiales bacterium]|jgi:hypothetical protein|nr:hypothetical protein [Frankiales bacterium]
MSDEKQIDQTDLQQDSPAEAEAEVTDPDGDESNEAGPDEAGPDEVGIGQVGLGGIAGVAGAGTRPGR